MPRRDPRRPPRLAEFPLIRDLARRFGKTGASVRCGIGDDAAVLRAAPGDLLITTDLLAEGIHFDRTTAGFEDIGYKAAVANLSDIAAMGGTPSHLLVALAIPAGCSRSDIHRLYRGLMQACRPHRVELVGGDTSASKQGLFVSLTLTGTVKPGRALTRSGARVGDLLYVTGTIGDSLAGLRLLAARAKGRRRTSVSLDAKDRRHLIGRHLRPTPRLAVGRLLAERRIATAAIDVSDGLSGDLVHICDQSDVGVEIQASALPLSPACLRYAGQTRTPPWSLALTGGEDYELLFTVRPGHRAAIERLSRSVGCRLSCIGTIRAKRLGRRLIQADGTTHPLPVTGYRHFSATAGPG